jgi:hypothetical protein
MSKSKSKNKAEKAKYKAMKKNQNEETKTEATIEEMIKTNVLEAYKAGELHRHNDLVYTVAENKYFAHTIALGKATDSTPPPEPKYKGPKVPYSLFLKCVQFNLLGWKKIDAEVQITAYAKTHEDGSCEWIAWPFKQTGIGLSTKETECEENTRKREELAAEGFDIQGMCFTMHNHCTSSSFQSGVDEADETKRPGIHITIGKLDKDQIDIHVRIVANFNGQTSKSGKLITRPKSLQWTPKWTDIIDFEEFQHFANSMPNEVIQNILCMKPGDDITIEESWLECVSKRQTTTGWSQTAPSGHGQFGFAHGLGHFPSGGYHHHHVPVHYGAAQKTHGSFAEYRAKAIQNTLFDMAITEIDPQKVIEFANIFENLCRTKEEEKAPELIIRTKDVIEEILGVDPTFGWCTTEAVKDQSELFRIIPAQPNNTAGITGLITRLGPVYNISIMETLCPNGTSLQGVKIATLIYACVTYNYRYANTKGPKGNPWMDGRITMNYIKEMCEVRPFLGESIKMLHKYTRKEDADLETAIDHFTDIMGKIGLTASEATSLETIHLGLNQGFITFKDTMAPLPYETALELIAEGTIVTYALIIRELCGSSAAIRFSMDANGKAVVSPEFNNIMRAGSPEIARCFPTVGTRSGCMLDMLCAVNESADEFDTLVPPIRAHAQRFWTPRDSMLLEEKLKTILDALCEGTDDKTFDTGLPEEWEGASAGEV